MAGDSGAENAGKSALDDLASYSYLLTEWKEIRAGLRQHTFRDFYLTQDPVQFAAYEWGLDPFLHRLVEDLRAATYTPDPADIIRGAKSTGLSRPLAFMSPRDALILRAIVDKARDELRKDLRPWTGAAKSEKRDPAGEDDDDDEYTDWFDAWLRRQGVIAEICERCSYVVESDISNFFGSVDLNVLQEYLLHQTSLHRDVVRLCMHIVRRTMRHPEYAESPSLGLPQETFDASRAIAHGLLTEVDAAFDIEGGDGIYSRFMDDFVTGVDSREEGERFIAILQRKLERLGLYPNPSKTRVIPVTAFLQESMADENAYLDSVDAEIDRCESDPPLRTVHNFDSDVLHELRSRAASFRSIPQEAWPKRYDRVRRRYFTMFRKLRVDDWLGYACGDMAAHPDSCRSILQYVRAFPLNETMVHTLFDSLATHVACYGDLPLLQLETVATAPNDASPELSEAIVQRCCQLAADVHVGARVPRSLEDWLLSALIPIIGKFANRGHQERFIADFVADKPPQSVARLQACPLQISHGRSSTELFHADLAGLQWSSVLSLDFIRSLEQADSKAVGIALNLLDPTVALMPNRYVVHVRPLMLCGVLARA